MPNGQARIVVVLSASSDASARSVMGRLRREFDVRTPASLIGTVGRSIALRAAFAGSDVVIGVVPSAPNRERSNIFVEIGIAVGAGARVLIVASHEGLPSSLRGLPLVNPNSPEAVIDRAVALMATQPYEPNLEDVTLKAVGKVEPSTPTYNSAYWRLTERELIDSLVDSLRRAGARVHVPKAEVGMHDVESPDFVLWHDGLQPNFDLPLPVEVVRTASTVPKIRSRLLRLMDKTGARSLLVISASGAAAPARWADGERQMLSVSADSLSSGLKRASLSDVLSGLLEEASA